MMSGGQRLGSPAVSSNLSGWLYPFIDSIDAKGYRCDFVAVHAYWNSNPTNFMNSLKSISDRTGRPLWITEFNYGANWTSEWWPSIGPQHHNGQLGARARLDGGADTAAGRGTLRGALLHIQLGSGLP
jgi:hypothetical protein